MTHKKLFLVASSVMLILAQGLNAEPTIDREIVVTGHNGVATTEKVKCRWLEVTGSLVKKGYVCKTAADWKRIRENHNAVARSMIEVGQICSMGIC
jgi:hypothetical protein